jgi:YbbR domain-containing protein
MKKQIKKIPEFFKVDKLRNNKNAIVFLVCVFIATVLWFLNALGKDYSTTISYPVKYVNAPARKFLANEPPSKLELKVDAHGFTLLRHKLSLSSSPIILSLSAITQGVQPTNRSYRVQTNRFLKRISSQVSNEITVNAVQPEELIIILDSLKSKIVKVKPNIDFNFKSQFNLKNPISLNPYEVNITGPATCIDTIKQLFTEYKEYQELDATVERKLEILHPEKTTIVPKNVLLKIDVEKFTEKDLKIPIQIKNKPANVNIKLFPSEITVKCLLGLSEYENITAADFNATVDYEAIGSETTNLAVSIDSKPSFIQLIRFTPESVEYLIETN